MKPSKRRKRTARKLILPLIAVGMMTTMMFMEASQRSSHASSYAPAPVTGAAARVGHDVRHR